MIHLAQSGAVDVVLMDISLANSHYEGQSIDGIRMTQLLKSDPQTEHLPVLLLTAHAMAGDREQFLQQSGADGYITKPVIDHQIFIDQIRAAIAKTTLSV